MKQNWRQEGHAPVEHDGCGIGAVVDILGRKTHRTVDDALKIVEGLEHRAGKDAQGKTGDGVGILVQISHRFFAARAAGQGIDRLGEGDYGLGMFFFPREASACARAKTAFEETAAREGLEFLGWREVPVRPEILGQKALDKMPAILQGFVKRPRGTERGLPFDRRLYLLRRAFERARPDCYVASLSSRTVVYKGMFLVDQLRRFYPDLQDESYESAIALVHSRFSTNTDPSWERAHPNRVILHNGEINTIRGNLDRMTAREETMSTPALELEKALPVVDPRGSDSAMLDNTLEFLMMAGMDLPLAVMAAIPEPWKRDPAMTEARRALYQYHAILMEPWDGPAAILFTDGDRVGAVLDRNGLRPARYYRTADHRLILASEAGVLDLPPEDILEKSRLEPGRMLLVDTREGRVIPDGELKEKYAARHPYGDWLRENLVRLEDLPDPGPGAVEPLPDDLTRLQAAFGYTAEDLEEVILPMARDGSEPVASMGADIPLAVLDRRDRPLFAYFRQLFAQVTNPPMDALREEVVTDTSVYLGDDGNLLEERASNCRVLRLDTPVLTDRELAKIRAMDRPGFAVETVSLLYPKDTPLKDALDRLFRQADEAQGRGANLLILSDRGVDGDHLAIPSLLAVSAMEQHLVRTKKRTAVSVVLESAEPREVHHFAALLGYGARAVNPYLAQETAARLASRLGKDPAQAVADYNAAVLHGIVKVAAKMGISTVQAYQSAQIFEAVGIRPQVVDRYFTNTASRAGGIGLEEIGAMVARNHARAFQAPEGTPVLESPGEHRFRPGGEDHLFDPQAVRLLREAVRTGDYGLYQQYAALVEDKSRAITLRGLLELKEAPVSIPLEEVESEAAILRRFKTGAMSYGSISQEAHQCLALAMNRLGGCSNSGEGGEDPCRLGGPANSRIKQVASGRFGVTSQYLVSADEIQIKLAQGAKPGEGGHLPGKKVYPWIARTRHATPGVALISPPPHHDIYSIEDLAQLIYDLKNANPRARISVKLASENGVGTVAAGAAKAGAQAILISGYDGGTGAAPRSSIHSAGLPWELGVAETHRALIQNGLRSRVVLEADGKLMTGRDVAVACMLGAEEFSFATAPLVALGCVMDRACHLDSCPVGIATQDPELRKRFRGRPEDVMNFMTFVARDLRERMARLGVRTVDDLVGRADLLRQRRPAPSPKAGTVDLSLLLDAAFAGEPKTRFDPADAYDFRLEETADLRVLAPQLRQALEAGARASASIRVSSKDRALGTLLGSQVTRRFGDSLPPGTIHVRCFGGAGQSFGAFLPKGMVLELEGDANDYLGKGLSGGELILYPPKGSPFRPWENVIAGNVALYGATSGRAFLAGRAGERFCVRNSGADAVAEGIGDHGCEYMTGGRVVILGPVGKNFAAGMSGGVAYLLDQGRDLEARVNRGMVTVGPVSGEDAGELRGLIQAHVEATGSVRGREVLEGFQGCLPLFRKVVPVDYQRVREAIARLEARGMGREEAELGAFYGELGR